MNVPEQIAKHLREIHFGGSWTDSDLKSHLAGVTREQAMTKIGTLNTIAGLVYHINYFVAAVLPVLRGGILDANDRYSFDHPAITSDADWEKLVEKTFADAEACASLIEQLPENKLSEDFTNAKYGSYYRNLHGLTEHAHYHLGQIVLIKKLIASGITK
jgi:hypothetical protein